MFHREYHEFPVSAPWVIYFHSELHAGSDYPAKAVKLPLLDTTAEVATTTDSSCQTEHRSRWKPGQEGSVTASHGQSALVRLWTKSGVLKEIIREKFSTLCMYLVKDMNMKEKIMTKSKEQSFFEDPRIGEIEGTPKTDFRLGQIYFFKLYGIITSSLKINLW